jgi:predicted DNA-binding transcriptional regulator AlpA
MALDHQPLDRLYRTKEVATLEGISTRTLFDYVRSGRFPPPDVKAETRGAPDRWYGSTLQRVREERKARAAQIKPQAAA